MSSRGFLWIKTCQTFGNESSGNDIWYCDSIRGPTNEEDHLAAIEDAAKGDERAIRYVAKYAELRMKDEG